ncbi:Toll-like receptor Tollo [Gryllus bimaculatus]|nr:Toll-like receptor Tollo [Gryllus bimaculatus]
MEDERGRAAARAWAPGRPPPPRPRPRPLALARVEGVALLWLAVAAACLPLPAARAICPSKCACDDEVLRATCESAGLEVVPIQLNPEVRSISLRGNRIVSLHMSFTFYMNLRWLDVSRNRVASLGARVFEFQEKLVHLNISGNEVSTLSKDAFRGLRSLRVLDLSDNLLEALPAAALVDTPDLAELYLASNRLLSVPSGALRRLPALKLLGLSDNLLEALEEEALPALRDLRALHLRGNVVMRVHRAAFDGLPALQTLDLSDNNLTSVPTAALAKLARLADLDLSGNALPALEPVAFQSLFELRRLRLSRLPRLRRVDARALADNVRLESVQLDDTGLDTLPARLFHDRRALVHISFPLDQLRSLALGDNPLHCNCSLLWLWLLTRRQLEVEARNASAEAAAAAAAGGGGGSAGDAGGAATLHLDVDAIRCAEPEPLRYKLVAEAPEAAVRCDASWLSVIIVAIVVLALFAGTVRPAAAGRGRAAVAGARARTEAEASARACLRRRLRTQPAETAAVLMLSPARRTPTRMEGVVLGAKDAPPAARHLPAPPATTAPAHDAWGTALLRRRRPTPRPRAANVDPRPSHSTAPRRASPTSVTCNATTSRRALSRRPALPPVPAALHRHHHRSPGARQRLISSTHSRLKENFL